MLIYGFIKSIRSRCNDDTKAESLRNLRRDGAEVRLEKNLYPGPLSKDADSDNGVLEFGIEELSVDTCYSIIYIKKDDREDFTALLLPFILMQHEFGNIITLGIDICNLRIKDSYCFKCGDFLIHHSFAQPKLGTRSVYFIMEQVVDEKTGEIVAKIKHLPGKGDGGNSTYKGSVSRRFLPLIHITENDYERLFFKNNDDIPEEYSSLKDSIAKIRADLKKACSFEFESSFDSESIVSQWLEAAYFFSYDQDELKGISNQIKGISNTLEIFKDSIQELIQNIIFHGGKEGLFYCVFDKKANVSNSFGKIIPDFDDYGEDVRFMRIGVFDYGEKGIVDTFMDSTYNPTDEVGEEDSRLTLTDFFDINSIVTTGLTRPDLRYTAHLGIKTFVKTIVDNKGFFSVQSCEKTVNGRVKKALHTRVDNYSSGLSEEVTVDFVKGTHYEIIVPVLESIIPVDSSVLVQTKSISKSFSKLLSIPYPLQPVRITPEDIKEIGLCKNKQEQKKRIEGVCKRIVARSNAKQIGIALDLANRYVSPSLIFKITAFLQLHLRRPVNKIILVNATSEFTKEFCSIIERLLINANIMNNKVPVWSRKCALVILCGGLHARIVWGRSKDELFLINREYRKLYYNHFLDVAQDLNPFEKEYSVEGDYKKQLEDFVLPYDVLIKTGGHKENGTYTTPFDVFLDQLLRREIVSEYPGLSVNHENTFIGKKIIVKNFYEADSLFQNSFFVERFAFLIARGIRKELAIQKEITTKTDNNRDNKDNEVKKEIVLIGYKYYSEFLLKTIQDQMKPFGSIHIGICNEGKDFSDNNVSFNFAINGDEKKTENEIIMNPQNYLFATIVPIGATLSTNDKVISLFKLWLEKKIGHEVEAQDIQFFYNHCAIVVRDRIGAVITPLEEEQRWKAVDLNERFIETRFRYAIKVYYTSLIADRDNLNNGNWIKRLNRELSFPRAWNYEEYVNLTENSSINSQNLMDYPVVDYEANCEGEELDHIHELKDYIYKGHLKRLNSHHKYYIDTESFVRQKRHLVNSWLKGIRFNDSRDLLNVLVTPNVENESDFVSAVNDVVFDGSALIIYLDVNNWRNNIVNKLSFLRNIDKVRYHYVDQAFLTGDTYEKAKCYLFSIVEAKGNGFQSAFTIVNRMHYAKSREIKNDLHQAFFSYVTLFYPVNSEGEHECELCRLDKYYDDLSKKTVLQSCTEVIQRNRQKIKPIDLDEIRRENWTTPQKEEWNKRIFIRLIITHWLFYKISVTAHSDCEFELKKKKVKETLDSIYSSFSDGAGDDNCLLNQKFAQWFHVPKPDLFSDTVEEKGISLDKRISFLKAISSPPLSKYIAIREYAHKKLLDELYDIINNRVQHDVDDLRLLKSVLKSLSFLKSNALARKEVIVGIWGVLKNVIDGMDEGEMRKTVQDFSKDAQFFIKNAIVGDESKATFLGELLRRGKEIDDFNSIKISSTLLSISPKSNDSLKIGHNDLFNVFDGSNNSLFKREYARFLVWVFYDNTTIIRNTLTNFSMELDKSDRIRELFYDDKNLKSITEFKKNINKAIISYKNIIQGSPDDKIDPEYYYSSFKPYLDNGDKIDFVEKLLYVTYAKFKLVSLIEKKSKTAIETDTRVLLENLASLMGADTAFWVVKRKRGDNADTNGQANDDHLYTLSLYDKSDSLEWDYDRWRLNDNFYTKIVYSSDKEIVAPIVPLYSIKSNQGERKELDGYSLCIFRIADSEEFAISDRKRMSTVSSITFLYKKDNPLRSSESDFRVKIQEYSRLLLLLKNEIDSYVNDYLLQEKVFDIWVEKLLSSRRFEKIYSNSAHVFNSVYAEMEEFEGFDKTTIEKLSRTWFFLTNETISFLYSSIERNPEHRLDLDDYYIIDENNTLGKTFNKPFIDILSALLKSRWKGQKGETKNTIYINGWPLDKSAISGYLKDVPIQCNKHLLRTFVAQCIHNSLSPIGNHGHRFSTEIKRVDIFITESRILIKDSCMRSIPKAVKVEQARLFQRKKGYIKDLICDEYSSTTLTSLQGFVNYLGYSCDYTFDEDNNFKVLIVFNPSKDVLEYEKGINY